MKILKSGIVLVVICLVAYWAYDSIRERVYTGSEVEFVAGNGNIVTIENSGGESVDLAVSSRSSFGMTSSSPDPIGSPTREGSGRNLVYSHAIEVPTGTTDFRINRGSEITFSISGESAVDVVVAPMSSDNARNTVLFAGAIILAALFYLSRTFEHQWIRMIRQRISSQDTPPTQPTSASEFGS